jgi:hypothetical protein
LQNNEQVDSIDDFSRFLTPESFVNTGYTLVKFCG